MPGDVSRLRFGRVEPLDPPAGAPDALAVALADSARRFSASLSACAICAACSPTTPVFVTLMTRSFGALLASRCSVRAASAGIGFPSRCSAVSDGCAEHALATACTSSSDSMPLCARSNVSTVALPSSIDTSCCTALALFTHTPRPLSRCGLRVVYRRETRKEKERSTGRSRPSRLSASTLARYTRRCAASTVSARTRKMVRSRRRRCSALALSSWCVLLGESMGVGSRTALSLSSTPLPLSVAVLIQ
mmetsp:Transcript_33282/g.102783  ORF Transcript_33282/g.102783 Transcript_33282/m.102783 type:complete len:248 (-) Transcript_33282:1233-1976(-)